MSNKASKNQDAAIASRNMENHPPADQKINSAIFALWRRFQLTMLARLEAIEQAGSAVTNGALNDAVRKGAVEGAHKLAGSLGTFGLGEGSKMAAELELMLEGESPLGPAECGRLQELTGMLRKEIERGPAPPTET